jgi:hypothetical protein
MVKAFRGDHCIRLPEIELNLTMTVKPGNDSFLKSIVFV